jgi:hypothetical protein
MKLKIKHFQQEIFEQKLDHLANIHWSLFVDDIPTEQNDLSTFNVLVLQEPNEYFGIHDWAIENKHLFSFILTWDDKVLNNCDNALYLPFGHTWFKPEQYTEDKQKEFKLSHLCGALNKTYGHSLRHELLIRQNEINISKNFHFTYGDRYDIEDARKGKEIIFGDSMFGVAIENTSHNGYFTEKILDCFLQKTIPVYWGCTSIQNHFIPEGIISFNNIDELIVKVNQLDESYYNNRLDIINENYKRALAFVDYEQNIIDAITAIFSQNNLL